MANRHRGDVDLELGGQRYTLRLTLGALAELEAAFDAPDLAALGRRLAAGGVRAGDLVALLGAAIRGGGERLDDGEVAALAGAADLPAIATALARLLAQTFGEAPEARPRKARR